VPRRLPPPLLLLLLAAAPVAARAWGPGGHAAVGRIAERRLSPATRAQVTELLDGARISDAEVATWADAESTEGRAPRAFHYVNVPAEARGYDPRRDCADHRCIVAKLEEELVVLRDRARPRARRADALRWVVHLMGDLHQPLHCADRGDHGGNDTPVLRRGRSTNLHALWDGLPDRCGLDVPDPEAFQLREGPQAWVDECHALGRDVYADAFRYDTGDGLRLPRRWAGRQCELVEQQIGRAGVRLAAALNRALAR
jgi:hypothetical protein